MAGDAEGQGGAEEPGDPNGLEGHQGLGGMGDAGAGMAGAPEPAHDLTLQDLAETPCQAWADRPWQGLVDMLCLGQVD